LGRRIDDGHIDIRHHVDDGIIDIRGRGKHCASASCEMICRGIKEK
jgi:hypothetical protein